jgi:hypothetical protein
MVSRYSFKLLVPTPPRYGTKTYEYFSSLRLSSDLFSRTFECPLGLRSEKTFSREKS